MRRRFFRYLLWTVILVIGAIVIGEPIMFIVLGLILIVLLDINEKLRKILFRLDKNDDIIEK